MNKKTKMWLGIGLLAAVAYYYWEKSAKEYILTDVLDKSFLGVSKCLDMETLEPRVVFHGTRTNEEFFVFNANMKGGRPYGYFAFNEQYSENFTANSQNH